MEKKNLRVACSRRSDSGARAKNKARERAGKKRGETGEEDVSPRFFPALSLAIFFARAPLSERLEQANVREATAASSRRPIRARAKNIIQLCGIILAVTLILFD